MKKPTCTSPWRASYTIALTPLLLEEWRLLTNPIIESMLNRRSVRKYTDQKPTDEEIATVVRAGQQAPFALQLCSVLLSRKTAPYGALLWFTFCLGADRLELIMTKRGWTMVECDLSLLMGIQDVALMAENMVIAAESLDMGSCFLGMTPYQAVLGSELSDLRQPGLSLGQ